MRSVNHDAAKDAAENKLILTVTDRLVAPPARLHVGIPESEHADQRARREANRACRGGVRFSYCYLPREGGQTCGRVGQAESVRPTASSGREMFGQHLLKLCSRFPLRQDGRCNAGDTQERGPKVPVSKRDVQTCVPAEKLSRQRQYLDPPSS